MLKLAADLLTHDVTTITRYAYERVERELPMPGVFEVSRDLPIGQAIEDILLLVEQNLSSSAELTADCGNGLSRLYLRISFICSLNLLSALDDLINANQYKKTTPGAPRMRDPRLCCP